jgi:hypothetical protein
MPLIIIYLSNNLLEYTKLHECIARKRFYNGIHLPVNFHYPCITFFAILASQSHAQFLVRLTFDLNFSGLQLYPR